MRARRAPRGALAKEGTAHQENGKQLEEPSSDAKKASGSEKPVADGDGSSAEEQQSEADRKTHEAIERALKENWGLREVKRYVDKAIGTLDPQRPKKMGRPRVPFKWNKRRLQVDVERLDALDASQKAAAQRDRADPGEAVIALAGLAWCATRPYTFFRLGKTGRTPWA